MRVMALVMELGENLHVLRTKGRGGDTGLFHTQV